MVGSSVVGDAPGLGASVVGGVDVVVVGGAGAAAPNKLAVITRRFEALYFGWQVVKVSRSSLVGARTATSLGETTCWPDTLYTNEPCFVVTSISSPGFNWSR